MLHHYSSPLRGDLASVSRQPFNRLFSLWLLLAGSTAAVGQTVTGLTPTRNANAAPLTTNVSVTASAPFASGASNAIKVFSSQAGGKKAGTATVSSNTLTFDPASNFKPGETVFTTLTTASGLSNGHVHQFTTAAAPAPGLFSGSTQVKVGFTPVNVVAADVDRDGDLDFLTANFFTHNVSVRLNDGTGAFSGSTDVGVGTRPYCVAAAVVDGDGDLDILAANAGSNTVSVRFNDGTGAFSGSTEVGVGQAPMGVAAADVDGDGDLDILAANDDSQNVSVRFNDGTGAFSGSTEVGVSYDCMSVAAADVDGDGDLDILAANALDNTVSVRFNNGSGSFSGTTNVEVGYAPENVAAADVDKDGDLDLLTANRISESVSVRFNNGSGSFSGDTEVAAGKNTRAVTAADIEGDGDLDILTANFQGNTVSVRLNNGSGSFSGTTDIGVGSGPLGVAAADVDGDGDLDILAANGGSNTVSVRLNQFYITLSDINKVTETEDETVSFSSSDFTNAFSSNGGSLSKVKITSLPSASTGVLEVNGVAVTLNQEIVNADLAKLTFVPAENYNGSVNFNWNGSYGTTYVASDATVHITLAPVNDAPSFVKGADQKVLEDAGLQTITGWATAISKGAVNESDQTIDFVVTSNNDDLFSIRPAVSDDGTLTFTPATNAFGSATVSVKIKDDGGTAHGGVDESAVQTFAITVTAVNDAPSFVIAGNPATVNEDAGPQTVTAFATSLEDGDPEVTQALTFTITGNSNGGLFSVAPAIADDGTLTYTPAAHANGSALIKVTLSDNGSASDPHVNTSTEKTFTVTVNPVNDVPSFTKGADQTVNEDAGEQTVTGWATAISKGPTNESAQAIDFLVTSNNSSLFSAQPAVADDGTLTYTPAAHAFGSATVSVKIKDNGGTAHGGVDESATQTFTITVTAVNDAPVVSVTPASQQGQYSDQITLVAISATDVDNDLNQLTAATSWKLASAASFTTGLPDALSFTKTSDGHWTLSGRTMLAPGTYLVRVRVSDGTADESNNASYSDIELIVLPEDARATYTGALFASTASATSTTATVTLSATLQDITATADANGDLLFGDIRKAKVSFINRDNNQVLASNVAVGLVSSGDTKTGTATVNVSLSTGNANAASFTIGIIVTGYYTRDHSADNTVVTVSKPLGDFITGGGYVTLSSGAGLIQPKQGSKNNFGFNVKYTKSGTNLQGNLNTIIRSENGKVYQVKGNVMTSLAVNASTKTALFNGKANIQDITNPLAPLPVDGNASLQVSMTDGGEPGSSDKIAITVWNKAGGLWFASHWNGSKTTEQLLSGGNLKVSSKTSFGATPTARTATSTTTEDVAGELAVVAYPNPVFDKLTLRIPGHLTGELALTVTDSKGVPLSRQVVEALPAGQALPAGERKVEIDFSDQAPGLYLLQVQAGSRHRVLKLVKLLR